MDAPTIALDGGLFQSAVWKDFQKSLGKEIFETDLFWGVVQTSPILGSYGEVSRGPTQKHIDTQFFGEVCQTIAEKYNFSFLRIEPQQQSFLSGLHASGLNIRKAPFNVQPKETFRVTLHEEETSLAQMKSKTRYNIRLAQKKGIQIKELESQEEEEQLLDILAKTAERKNIQFHSRAYYQQFLRFFTGEKGRTFLALHEGRVLAGSILIFHDETVYYVHGGSSDVGKNKMAPYFLQWEQMRFAKAEGYRYYDFGGVSTQEACSKKKDWQGITRFKQGFAPKTEPILFPGTFDIIFSPFRYHSYGLLSALKKKFL